MSPTAVLLASFGGPEGPEEVMPFLERVTSGRGVPRERLEQVATHYLALGGISPINEQNRALLAALRAELAQQGSNLPVYWGNRNAAPFFADALREMHADGHREGVVLLTSAYSSYSGCRQYRENIAAALDETGLAGDLTLATVGQYFDDPGFIRPFARGVAQALDALAADGIPGSEVALLCSTHSVPESMASTSGPGAGWYVSQHERAVDALCREVEQIRGAKTPPARLVYQSRSGPPTVPWLEPDVNEALEEAAASGARAAVVVPIGFVSDHVEVIWDLDREAAETCERLGLRFVRAATPGTDPEFVSSLARLVTAAAAGTVRSAGCGAGCCPNPRADLPTIPGPPED